METLQDRAFNWMAHHPWPTLWFVLPLSVAAPCWVAKIMEAWGI